MRKLVAILFFVTVMASTLGCGNSNEENTLGESNVNILQEETKQEYDNSNATPVEYLKYSIEEDGVSIYGLSDEFTGT